MESYAHKAAKAVFADWLRTSPKDKWGDPEAFGCYWRPGTSCLNGVWEEYPLIRSMDTHTVWSEVDQITDDWMSSPWQERPPSYDELCRRGKDFVPYAILDLAIQHKGFISYGFEIVHKHKMSDYKRALLGEAGLSNLAEIPAAWILGQVGRPAKMPQEFWCWGGPR